MFSSIVMRPLARTSPRAETISTAGRSLTSSVLRLATWPVRFYQARRNFAVLAAMSEYQLKDIGLTRQDILNVTALPRDEDPTPELARMVRERQSSRGRPHSGRR